VSTAARTYAMLENESLWQTAERCDELLRAAGLPYLVAGGVAVCLHGYRRNTVDLDLVIRAEDQPAVRELLEQHGFQWDERVKEFRGASGTPVQFLLSGSRAGRDAQVKLPDPGDAGASATIEDLPVVSLPRLIEMKLACGSGNLRRTHKDFADVVELIAIHQLDGPFAARLHRSVRKPFRELLKHARGDV
jgi:hypothetical protein